jgi:hypothetical protein
VAGMNVVLIDEEAGMRTRQLLEQCGVRGLLLWHPQTAGRRHEPLGSGDQAWI